MKGSPDTYHLLTNNNRKFPNKDCNIHQRNLQKLVTEILRVKIGLTHQDVHEVLKFIEKLHSL